MKTASSSLAGDVVRFTQDANDMYDAQLAGENKGNRRTAPFAGAPGGGQAHERLLWGQILRVVVISGAPRRV